IVRGVPGSVLPLHPWHLLVLLHQVSYPEEVTPSIIDHKVYFTFLSELEKQALSYKNNFQIF
ncbi:hypothetical protein, partial [Bacillus pumilus]|uniref:hypothetical protein n=1 Tax=Bacillus pumilus TaxID=1408 RepID=UPI003AD9B2DB